MRGVLSRLGRRDDRDQAREVAKSEQAWREQLTPEQCRVLRRRGTQAPFGPQRAAPGPDGRYRCAACDAPLFPADAKFDSGTGWPSFSEADGFELHKHFRLGIPRTEVRCRRCGGHLGHVFGDGPGPTGKRYCINDCALSPGDGA